MKFFVAILLCTIVLIQAKEIPSEERKPDGSGEGDKPDIGKVMKKIFEHIVPETCRKHIAEATEAYKLAGECMNNHSKQEEKSAEEEVDNNFERLMEKAEEGKPDVVKGEKKVGVL